MESEAQPARFHDLWNRHAGDVYHFALYLSGDPATAEDLTSEAFLRIWSRWDRVKWPTVRSYLLAITHNLYRQHTRLIRREAELDVRMSSPGSLAADAERQEELQQAFAAIQQLGETDRAAFLLRIEHELPYEEIAALLKLPLSTVKVKVHRARLRIAESCHRSVSNELHSKERRSGSAAGILVG